MTEFHILMWDARHVVTVIVFVCTLRLLSSAQRVTDNSVTCDVPWVEPLANTSLTCHFPENVSQTRRIASISFYKDMNWRDEDDIMDCWWISGKMDCTVGSEYSFNRMISNKLILEIPRVSPRYIGGYACKLSKMNPDNIKPCELNIKLVGKTVCDVLSVPLNSRTSLTCYFPQDLSKTRADFSVYHYSRRGDTDVVMSCKWKGDNPVCIILRGYEFDVTNVTNHVTVGIPNAQEDQEGFYSCHLTSAASVLHENCSVTFVKVTSSCNIPSVKETEPASLTCTFSVDVRETKKNFSLVRVGGGDSKGVDIVTCTWLKNQLRCTTSLGYEFNNIVTHHLIITVPRASRDHNGTYACYVEGSKTDNFYPCEFIIMPVTSSCNITSVKETEPASLTCTFNVDVNATKSSYSLVRLGGNDSKAVDIVTCTWVNDQLRCTTAPGYEFNNKVTDHLVITVPRASRDHNGTYACHVAGTNMDGFQPCDFIVEPDGPLVVLTVAIVVVMLIPVSLLILILALGCRRRGENSQSTRVEIHRAKNVLFEGLPLLSPEELESFATPENTFWLQWVEAAFPDLDSSVYFLPPVHVNCVSMTRETIDGQDVRVLQPAPPQADESNLTAAIGVDDSDVRHDAAMQRFLVCLQTMCQQNKEVLVGLSQLPFIDYLGEPCYAAAARKISLPATLPPDLPREWKQGDFDVLLIHRHFGLVTCEVKTFGGNVNKKNIPKNTIRTNLKKAITQLDRAKAMLSHLVSDVAPSLRITKTIAFPNLTVSQVQDAIVDDLELTQDLCRCLGATDPADIAGLYLCSDQLSDPKTPCDVSSHVLRELGYWWQRRVGVAGPESQMTPELYKTLVARFCGPATSVTVPCTSPPRVSVKTLGQAVWCTGECYTAVITLFPEQLHLLNTQPPTLFVTGPPGTGKTVVLLMMGIKWLRCGHHVYIVSTCDGSRAACTMLYHLLLQTVKTQQSAGVSPGQPRLLMYRLVYVKEVDKAVNDLSQAASGGSLYIIADEPSNNFKTFCDKLLAQVPCLHLWAARYSHVDLPTGWQVEYLTRPIRLPPTVVREVEQDVAITIHRQVQPYSERGVSDHTDGPPVRRLYHRGQGHSGDSPGDCVTCGREVASFLHSLRVGVTDNVTTTSISATSTNSDTIPPCLQWRDVLVLYVSNVRDDSGIMKGLEEAGIPVQVMKDEDDIEDVATARSNKVWVANGYLVQGMERKVVVCLDTGDNIRLYFMSRCTSQLVIVSH